MRDVDLGELASEDPPLISAEARAALLWPTVKCAHGDRCAVRELATAGAVAVPEPVCSR